MGCGGVLGRGGGWEGTEATAEILKYKHTPPGHLCFFISSSHGRITGQLSEDKRPINLSLDLRSTELFVISQECMNTGRKKNAHEKLNIVH